MVFPVPLRKEVPLGPDHTVSLVRVSRVILKIDEEVFETANSCIEYQGYTIRTRVEDGRVDLFIPDDLAIELKLMPRKAKAVA